MAQAPVSSTVSQPVATDSVTVAKEESKSDSKMPNVAPFLKQLHIKKMFVGFHFLPSDRIKSSHNEAQYSIFSKIADKEKMTAITQYTSSNVEIDRSVGSMCGMAIGDAVGHPFEFIPILMAANDGNTDMPRADKPWFSAKDRKWYNELNRFQLKRGQWTDDASMGLCIADSLIINQYYSGSDIRIRFWNWWHNGYNNAFTDRGSVGLGGNIGASIYALNSAFEKEPSPIYEVNHDREDSGNGSIMRLAAVPIFFHKNMELAQKYSELSSFTTHPGYIAGECCRFMAYIIVRSIKCEMQPINDVAQWLTQLSCDDYRPILAKEIDDIRTQINAIESRTTKDDSDNKADDTDNTADVEMKQKEHGKNIKVLKRQLNAKNLILRLIDCKESKDSKEVCWNWRRDDDNLPIIEAYHLRKKEDSYNGYPVSPGYWGSYCMDGLAMALYCVYKSDNFGDAIERCVNMLGDADTTGSITGQIAGAIYGYQSIINQKTSKFMIDDLIQFDHCQFAMSALLLYTLGCDYADSDDINVQIKKSDQIKAEATPPPPPPQTTDKKGFFSRLFS